MESLDLFHTVGMVDSIGTFDFNRDSEMVTAPTLDMLSLDVVELANSHGNPS